MNDIKDYTLSIAPILVLGTAIAGLFWQQNSTFQSFESNFLSLREHSEYQVSTRRELDKLQKQIDTLSAQLSEFCKKGIK